MTNPSPLPPCSSILILALSRTVSASSADLNVASDPRRWRPGLSQGAAPSPPPLRKEIGVSGTEKQVVADEEKEEWKYPGGHRVSKEERE